MEKTGMSGDHSEYLSVGSERSDTLSESETNLIYTFE